MDEPVTPTCFLQQDFSTLSQAAFPAATIQCFLWLLPQPLLKTLQSQGAHVAAFCCPREIPAINSKILQSGRNNSIHITRDISYKSSQPVRNPDAREDHASMEKKAEARRVHSNETNMLS